MIVGNNIDIEICGECECEEERRKELFQGRFHVVTILYSGINSVEVASNIIQKTTMIRKTVMIRELIYSVEKITGC